MTLQLGCPSGRASLAPDAPLYEARRKLYPQSVSGTYRRIKWALLAVCLGIYYLLPFVRWNRDGKHVHIFNPSDFTLAVFSIVLLATGTTSMTSRVRLTVPPSRAVRQCGHCA